MNANPVVFERREEEGRQKKSLEEEEEDVIDAQDAAEIFDLIRDIKDPEHEDLTLEQLNVLQEGNVTMDEEKGYVHVYFTPTVPHCSASTLIGLCIRLKLMQSLPPRYKIDVKITPGTHLQEQQVNKQLADKERVAAALENKSLLDVVHKCLMEGNRIS
ncbi:hypothetical protein GUITHDRAFT_65530 [Guillardia theta CCMP2712]|uniref:MIP18 family-like domain-containing protein n=1 Tax=Guillardia theta (strain CCMP2712) TaxID=905079 RepID=L1JVW0_GUITC|nr:hypothetical protein GUITHDRAFT_65530 [Guillardia theta CCMP2712]EKX52238.1 hypothetical protein GUITHDRAFT_65530 [Guillardia theta CCMP2712]|eukprot:XP_005839218.1 hypothetical protein GUITHDRAFT_65530 [Guillardia theta CCMP2712]